jgi:hypothetical protein
MEVNEAGMRPSFGGSDDYPCNFRAFSEHKIDVKKDK